MNVQTLLMMSTVLAPLAMSAGTDCASLAALKLPHTSITVAQSVAAGAFKQPEERFAMTNGTYDKLPAFCRVAGVLKPSSDSLIRFEVWMPIENWNHKFQGVGNGGFAGYLPFPELGSQLTLNSATAGTDTGHIGGDASWAPGHPEKAIDFGYRAIHETAVAAKAIIKTFYGEGPAHSYFSSCSNGGRQALMEAQRYPEDYDGIISGAPAAYWTHHFGSFIWTLITFGPAGAYIPSSKLNAIEAASVAACDADDGVKDGVIDDPSHCRWDPDVLLCKGADSATCLTAPQVKALKALYAGPKTAKGEQIYPGWYPGGEGEPGGWSLWVTGMGNTFSGQIYLGMQFFGSMVLEKPFWNFYDFDLDKDVRTADERFGKVLNAMNPDLTAFHRRGGKLILYQGWSDAAVSPQNTINYYESVVKMMGQEKTQQFARLFMVPGMEHCGAGTGTCFFGQAGKGMPYDADHDVNLAMERWVEKGIGPDTIIAFGPLPAGPDKKPGIRTRPLCPFPKVARWKGQGGTDDAANFACVDPESGRR
jgi:feruloyl esterase